MEISDRKKRILQAIVETHVATAEPVSSRVVAQFYPMSSATIRNTMSALVDMGLLAHPHTSSGRVPSDLGYRVYVDQLMRQYELTDRERQTINELARLRLANEINKIYSRITNYAVFSIEKQKKKNQIKLFHIIQIADNLVMFTLVTDNDSVKTRQLLLPRPIRNVSDISHVLSEYICGRCTADQAQWRLQKDAYIMEEALRFVDDSLMGPEVAVHGATNLLNMPEYRDSHKACEILEFLDEYSNISRLFNDFDEDFKIIIGRENPYKELENCSVLAMRHDKGTIGVIAPMRTNYPRAVSMLRYLKEVF